MAEQALVLFREALQEIAVLSDRPCGAVYEEWFRRLLGDEGRGGRPGNLVLSALSWAAELLRSLTPALEKFDIVSADVLDVDTMSERLHDEARRTGFPFIVVPLVAAWGRKPLESSTST